MFAEILWYICYFLECEFSGIAKKFSNPEDFKGLQFYRRFWTGPSLGTDDQKWGFPHSNFFASTRYHSSLFTI
jgi:hypothetical protein